MWPLAVFTDCGTGLATALELVALGCNDRSGLDPGLWIQRSRFPGGFA